jgi:hypothetical protein
MRRGMRQRSGRVARRGRRPSAALDQLAGGGAESGSSPALDGGDRDRKGRRLALPNDEMQLELETYEWRGKQLLSTSPQRELKE